MDERQQRLFNDLEDVLEPTPFGSQVKLNISFDEWTCIDTVAWVTVTVTWCSKNGEFKRCIATLRPFDSATKDITGSELHAVVNAYFAPLLLKGQDVVSILNSVTTDTAAVPMSAFKDEPSLRVGCICHIINLIFGDLQTPNRDGYSPELNAMMRDMKFVLAKFAKSPKVRRAYTDAWSKTWPGEAPLQPIYDVVMRWSSTFHLIVHVAGAAQDVSRAAELCATPRASRPGHRRLDRSADLLGGSCPGDARCRHPV